MKSISNDKYLEDEEQWKSGRHFIGIGRPKGHNQKRLNRSSLSDVKLKTKDLGVMSEENSSKNC